MRQTEHTFKRIQEIKLLLLFVIFEKKSLLGNPSDDITAHPKYANYFTGFNLD